MLLGHTYSSGTYTYTFMSPVITDETLLTRKVNKVVIKINVQSDAEEIGLDAYTVGNFTDRSKTTADIRNVTATTITPNSATSGTLNDNQFAVLQNIRQNLLRLNNELYYKNVEYNTEHK